MLAIKIGLIGAGRMATALGRGFVAAKLVPPSAIVASDPQRSGAGGLRARGAGREGRSPRMGRSSPRATS